MIGVAVMGCGVVGYGVVEMLIENKEAVRRAARQEVAPLYMLDVRDMDVPQGVTLTHNFDDILADGRVNVVVETIGGVRAAYEFTKRALESGRHVVTSNKELVATRGDELVALADQKGVRYLYEASVGGGIPVLHPVMQCLQGNYLAGVDGIVNGSTNYLLTQMKEKGVSFPAALGEAKRLGYVEADPAADVEGWDARRKLAILANACFGSRFDDEANIPTTGISGVTEDDMAALRDAHPDFIAFNYYGAGCAKYVDEEEGQRVIAEAKAQGGRVAFMTGLMTYPGIAANVSNPLQKKTSYGMGVDPVGLRVTLRQLWERYRLPLLITENGCGVRDELVFENGEPRIHDDYRIDYLRQHIEACQAAITDGVDLMGYSPWSAMDLISTHEGISKRYGMIYVDRDEFDLKEMKRYRKDSFFWYQKVCKSNGADLA